MNARRFSFDVPTHVLKCQRKNKRHVKNCVDQQEKQYLTRFGWYVNPTGVKNAKAT